MQRRTFLSSAAAMAASLAAMHHARAVEAQRVPHSEPPMQAKGPTHVPTAFKHSVCRWCFGSMPLDDLCLEAKAMGIASVELLNPEDWPTVAKHGLTCAVANAVKANPIPTGLNRLEHHDDIVKQLEDRLPLVEAAGIPNQIVFSGNRVGLSDAEGLKNCAIGLKRLTPLAESLGVTLIMELLNSKVDHGDYQCDRTAWGVELVNRVASPRFKLLYDIYHMQIMEGDVIRTITDHHQAIGHYHTAGNPGRNEIDETQELNYRAIAQAIKATGFTGYLAQEFMPRREPMTSLKQAIAICSV
jgi:hydroxypyruvate isomerase